jgi:predicted ester cyclase
METEQDGAVTESPPQPDPPRLASQRWSLATAGARGGAAGEQRVSVEDNKRLVIRAVTEVINEGDLEVVDELYAAEIAQAAKDWVAPFRAAFPDVRMTTAELVGEGDTVVGHFRCSGTHTGPWMGRPATGRRFTDVREVYWFTVRGGRIVDWWGLEDDDDRRRQLRGGTGT